MAQQTTLHMLIWQLESWFQELVRTLSEISEEEAKWKPTTHSKTVDVLSQWYGKRKDWISEQLLDPISTIEYKVVHLAQWKHRFYEYTFREGSWKWIDLECPEWPQCIEYLRQTQQSVVEALQTLTDEQLDDRVPTYWKEAWSMKKLISTLSYHDAYHLGQIHTIRNLYNIANKRKVR